MHPSSACTAGMFARNASRMAARWPGLAVITARTWIIWKSPGVDGPATGATGRAADMPARVRFSTTSAPAAAAVGIRTRDVQAETGRQRRISSSSCSLRYGFDR